MVELTDINLDSFLIRELKTVVSKHPRFRNLGGEITSQYATLMRYNDLEILVKNPSASGNRLSSDHYIATQTGRTVLAKLEDKDGVFIEHIEEIDKTQTMPEAGVYYFNLDSVNEGTGDLGLTIEKLRWVQGSVTNAVGSRVKLAPTVDPGDIRVLNLAPDEYSIGSNQITVYKYVDSLSLLKISTGHPLAPLAEYWVENYEEIVLTESTTFGIQALTIPDTNYIDVEIEDQDGYVLRQGIDYYYSAPNEIVLSGWTPSGQKITMKGTFKRNPLYTSFINPENKLGLTIGQNEQVILDQIRIIGPQGTLGIEGIVTLTNGDIYLLNLLAPGDNMTWETRVASEQYSTVAKKNAMNINLLPGLNIIIGDRTFIGDQLAVLVFPYINETYEIYGSKENVTFDIDIKTNDMRTSSELGYMVKEYLLVSGRERLETCGLTIYEVSRSTLPDVKDASGLYTTQHVILSIQAAADWEVRKPLVTRLDSFDIQDVSPDYSYPGKKISVPSLSTTYGNTRFLTSYH